MALLSLVVLIFGIYIATAAVHSLFFYPLANIPGPIFCCVSVLPSFYHAVKGDRHVWIWQNFQLYGDSFRTAPNLVLFNTHRAFTDIYSAWANTARSGFYKAWKRNVHDINTIKST
jgi:hypothetical protein